jgi:hypothetical protein
MTVSSEMLKLGYARDKIRSIYRSAVLVLVSIALFGCVSQKGNFQELAVNPGRGVIYIYTLPNSVLGLNIRGKALAFSISLDGKKLGLNGIGYHFSTQVEPGKHLVGLHYFTLLDNKTIYEIVNVEPGKSYYVRVNKKQSGNSILFTFSTVSEETGRQEIQKTHPG